MARLADSGAGSVVLTVDDDENRDLEAADLLRHRGDDLAYVLALFVGGDDDRYRGNLDGALG